MTKLLRILFFIVLLGFTASAGVAAVSSSLGVAEIEGVGVSVAVEGSTLHVYGAEGMKLEVVSLTGRRVAAVTIHSASQRVELNIPKGCYIVKVGSVVRKFSVS